MSIVAQGKSKRAENVFARLGRLLANRRCPAAARPYIQAFATEARADSILRDVDQFMHKRRGRVA